MKRRPTCGIMALNEYFFLYENRMLEKYNASAKSFWELKEIAEENGLILIPQKTFLLSKATPCIVKYGDNHFVLVHKVDNGKVYYSDNGIPCSAILDDFYTYFKGYILSGELVGEVLTEREALTVKGEFKFFKDFLSRVLPLAATVFAPQLGPMGAAILAAATHAATEYAVGRRPTALSTASYMIPTYFAAKTYGPAFQAAKATGATTPQAMWEGTKAVFGIPSQGRTVATVKPWSTRGSVAVKYGQTATPTTLPGGLMTVPPTPTTPTVVTPTTVTGGNVLGSVGGSLFQKIAPSLMVSTIGEAVAPKPPAYPQYPFERAKNIVERTLGHSPLYQLGKEKLTELMSGGELTKEDIEAITAPLEEGRLEAIREIKNRMQGIHRLSSGEAQKLIDMVNRKYELAKAATIRQAIMEAKRLQSNLALNAMGYDVGQISQMMALADRIGLGDEIDWALKYGDIVRLKQIFNNLASMIAEQQMTPTERVLSNLGRQVLSGVTSGVVPVAPIPLPIAR